MATSETRKTKANPQLDSDTDLSTLAENAGPQWVYALALPPDDIAEDRGYLLTPDDMKKAHHLMREFLHLRLKIKLLMLDARCRENMILAKVDTVLPLASLVDDWIFAFEESPCCFYGLVGEDVDVVDLTLFDDFLVGVLHLKAALRTVLEHTQVEGAEGIDPKPDSNLTRDLYRHMIQKEKAAEAGKKHVEATNRANYIENLVQVMFDAVTLNVDREKTMAAVDALESMEILDARIDLLQKTLIVGYAPSWIMRHLGLDLQQYKEMRRMGLN